MSGERSVEWKELGFLMLLAVLCAVITILQFRWTGELARAEFERLGKNQEEGTINFAETFDRELSSECRSLMPDADDFTGDPAKELSLTIRRWLNDAPDPWFKRIGVVIPDEDGLRLVLGDPKTGNAAVSEWPKEWSEFKEKLLIKLETGGEAFSWDQDGWLLEFPVMKAPKRRGWRGGGGGGLAGWLVVELDQKFVTEKMLPELVSKFLAPAGGRNYYEIKIKTALGEPILCLGQCGDSGFSYQLDFHHQGRDRETHGGPPGEPVWMIDVMRNKSELERITSRTRLRNLALGGVVNGLILLAGLALVGHSRRSRQLAKARMEFVANVSHELRTPVTVILGAAHNLKRGIVKGPEAVERYAGMIQQHAEQLSEMVQDVLDFSASKDGRPIYAKGTVDLADVVRSAMESAAVETTGMKVGLLMPAEVPSVTGDAAALTRAVGNLIRNAAKHAAEGRWIGIRVDKVKQSVIIEVSDRGPGIPRSEQDMIFRPFHRGETAKEKQVRGSGIGLGLVKEIVTSHGGRVSVCSEAGKGATFTITLPVEKTERS